MSILVSPQTDAHGTLRWFDSDGQSHRDGDEPAAIFTTGERLWAHHGKLHRDGDKPASVDVRTGYEAWWKYGKRHRDGGKPAVIRGDGSMEWWIDGQKVLKAVAEQYAEQQQIIREIDASNRDWERQELLAVLADLEGSI